MNRKGYIGAILLTLYASLSLAQQTPIDTVCVFDGPSRYAVPYQSGVRFEWSVGLGQITSSPVDSNVIWVNWSNAPAGLQQLSVVAIDEQQDACPGDTSEAWVLITAPKAARAKYPTEVCEGDVVILESGIAGAFMWKGGSTNRYQSFVASSDTSTYLIALNGSCDDDTVAFSIQVSPRPQASISRVPDTLIFGNELSLTFRGSAGPNALIDWYLNGQWYDQGQAVKMQFLQFGKNEIMQIVANGNCMDTTYKYLYVDDEFTAHFPNAFTPNGDGKNEIWNFSGVGHKSYTAGVYNRWGELIYQWTETSTQKGWDGTENNQRSIQGTFVYKVEIEDMRGEMHYFTNYFTLLR